jgi:DNA polymerase-3 subunit gamma/tau
MEYTVLARRFRPQSFGEVVGQEMISQALRNAIASNRVAHAYLFTGARGVGKTSTARILAKSLNCPNVSGGNPCNRCEVCRSISEGSDIDAIEIDGASNRGIDEIRALRANANIRPMRSPNKIYIIDEVHMLSKDAFNALLKTLEEPPANVKFIFCTTDPQKVPETILSRCQRFDFGAIATETIGKRLTEIAAAEGVQVEPKAVQLVARRAAGSMRDSQSLFDQLLAFGGKKIGAADVHRLLGTAPDERLTELGAALLGRDRARVLCLLDEALQSGVQVGELTDQLLAYFRDLMVLASGAGDALLLSVDNEQRETLDNQAAAAGLQSILAAAQILAETKNRIKGATYSRVLIELALVRIATLDQLDNVAELIGQLRQGRASAGGPAAPSVARTTVPATRASPPSSESPERSSPSAAPQQARESEGRPSSPVRVDASHREDPSQIGTPVAGGGGVTDLDSEYRNPASGAAASAATAAARESNLIAFERGREAAIWLQVISLLTDMAKSNAKNVCAAAITGPNSLVLTFPASYDFSRQYFERSSEQLAKIERAVERVVGRRVKVSVVLDESISAVPSGAAADVSSAVQTVRTPVDGRRDPLVQRAISVFGATVVRVETGTGTGQ